MVIHHFLTTSHQSVIPPVISHNNKGLVPGEFQLHELKKIINHTWKSIQIGENLNLLKQDVGEKYSVSFIKTYSVIRLAEKFFKDQIDEVSSQDERREIIHKVVGRFLTQRINFDGLTVYSDLAKLENFINEVLVWPQVLEFASEEEQEASQALANNIHQGASEFMVKLEKVLPGIEQFVLIVATSILPAYVNEDDARRIWIQRVGELYQSPPPKEPQMKNSLEDVSLKVCEIDFEESESTKCIPIDFSKGSFATQASQDIRVQGALKISYGSSLSHLVFQQPGTYSIFGYYTTNTSCLNLQFIQTKENPDGTIFAEYSNIQPYYDIFGNKNQGEQSIKANGLKIYPGSIVDFGVKIKDNQMQIFENDTELQVNVEMSSAPDNSLRYLPGISGKNFGLIIKLIHLVLTIV